MSAESSDPAHSDGGDADDGADFDDGNGIDDGGTDFEVENDGEDNYETSSMDVDDDGEEISSLDDDDEDEDEDYEDFESDNERFSQYAVEDIVDDLLGTDGGSEDSGDDSLTTLGKFVKRFDDHAAKDTVKTGDGEQKVGEFSQSNRLMISQKGSNSNNSDLWLSLPDVLMFLVLVKLPFSAFCSFRSVCKKWNGLMVYPDSSVMGIGDLRKSMPLCLMRTEDGHLACYNPLWHDWRPLPTNFSLSFGELGFTCGDQTELYGGSDGLLVLRPRPNWPKHGESFSRDTFWVLNPVNKSERSLAPIVKRHGKTKDYFLSVDEGQSSFKAFQVMAYRKRYQTRLRIHIYDSRSNSWTHTSYFDNAYKILTIIEFKGCIYGLVLRVHARTFRRPSSWILKLWESESGRKGWRGLLETPVRQIEGGRFWVRDGKLRLGVVFNYKLEPEEDSWVQPRRRTSCIWELLDDDVDKKSTWQEVARMPEELRSVLWTGGVPRVDALGDFMCIVNSSPPPGDTSGAESLGHKFGIMCHIPTNTWWMLPSRCNAIKLSRVSVLHSDHLNQGIPSPAFLFCPRMDVRL